MDAVARAGIDADEFVAFAHLDRLQHTDGFAAAALGADAHTEKSLDIGQSAAVQNGQFQVVQFDDYVVNAHADES